MIKSFGLPVELLQKLDDGGYEQCAPSPDAEMIDSKICNESQCEQCGYNGLVYLPFSKPCSYRAFAVCPDCKAWVEF